MKLNDYEKEHIRRLRRDGAECTLFLKRDQSFPLKEPEPVALYGNGARGTLKGGTGSGEVNSRFFVTAERGLERAGFTVTTKDWLDQYEQIRGRGRSSFIRRIKSEAREHHALPSVYAMGAVMPEPEYSLPLASKGETAVYVLSRISGEGSDRRPVRGDIILTHTEIRDILYLQEHFEKFLLVLNVGGPVDLLPIVGKVRNILLLSQLGVVTGDILADVLLGKACPSGKLTTSWAAWEDYPIIGTFGDFDDTYYREGIYVGYRYFDSIGRKVMFPFGFGLSYTDFSITESSVYAEGSRITVRSRVRNIGEYPGREVVQVYVSCPEGVLDQPFQMLAGWAKTKQLAPGEEEAVTIEFRMSDLSSFDTKRAAYLLEKGDYVVRVGNSSVDTKVASVLRLDETAVTRQVRNYLGKPPFEDWKPGKKQSVSERYGMSFPTRSQDVLREVEDPRHLIPVLKIQSEDIPYEAVKYPKAVRIDPLVDKMTDEELALFSVGSFSAGGTLQSVIGSASRRVPGAAGETTDQFKSAHIPPIVMADGPAGLRLTAKYGIDSRGTYSLSDSMEDNYGEFLPAPAKGFLRFLDSRTKKRRGEVHEQYTTAIPIGTAIAQSWNTDFARTCGDIIGDEMERFEIGLWLAPALNIQRDIRCGRNFEYYSEDPLISGRMAAAVVNGVQKHAGRGATIKHFAANNQERNRYANNSHVSERAMREIYLKGFEICIRESQPAALMTSYNLLNGIHTSERRDLNECILRHEFGFHGMVTTDWVIAGMNSAKTRYRGPRADKVAASGNDIFMPGSKKEYDAILSALRSGDLDRRIVKNNVTRIVKTARRLGDEF